MKEGKLKNKKVGGYAAEEKNQIPDQSTRSFTVVIDNTVSHFLVKNN